MRTLIVLLPILFMAPAAMAQKTARVSVGPSFLEANAGSHSPSFSADGRFVAFASRADNLFPGDTNGFEDIFLRDRKTGEVLLLSASLVGALGNGDSSEPSLSANGRYIAFSTLSSSFDSRDQNGLRDIYLHDRKWGWTALKSLGPASTFADAPCTEPVISADGDFLAFTTASTAFDSADTNGFEDVYFVEYTVFGPQRMSLSTSGALANGPSGEAAVSREGRFVVFMSHADNLVPGDLNQEPDIFLRDRQLNTTTLISRTVAGVPGNQASGAPFLSTDGDWIGFHSDASDLVPGDTNQQRDVFLFHRPTETMTRVSVDSSGGESNGGSSNPQVSANGRFVAFLSHATNLVGNDQNGHFDVFLHDTLTGQTTRMNRNGAGVEADRHTFDLAISSNGAHVGFSSDARNLVPGDTNQVSDVFVRTHGLMESEDSVVFMHRWTPPTSSELYMHWTGAPPASKVYLLASRSLGGSVFRGQNFDLGGTVRVHMERYSDDRGNGFPYVGVFPTRLLGQTVHMELAAQKDGQWFDSNVVSVVVQ
ncbi:MAG: TolB family protein [Planctomycetota bacterium]